MNTYKVLIDGKEEVVQAQKIKGEIWFHYQGQTFQYAPSSRARSGGQGSQNTDPTKILAPMPGKIIKVFKAVGDSVSEGDTVVAMEAMKMEYNLKAGQDMTIAKILVQEGQTVALGDLLVDMEEN